MTQPYADKQDQLQRVQEILIPGEQLLMVLDCKGRGSGFLGITDRRLVIRDDGFAKFKKNMISVPYSKIHAVGVESERGWVRGSSSLAFSAGDDDWELEFKGADKAKAAYMAIMQRVLGTAAPAAAPATPSAPVAPTAPAASSGPQPRKFLAADDPRVVAANAASKPAGD